MKQENNFQTASLSQFRLENYFMLDIGTNADVLQDTVVRVAGFTRSLRLRCGSSGWLHTTPAIKV